MTTGVVDAAGLAVLALGLAQPATASLAAARWTHRAPRSALALWLAIGLASGLAGVGALLSLGLAPLGGHLLPNLARLAAELAAGRDPLPAWSWPVTAAGLALLGRQLAVLARSLLSVAAHRRAHRGILDIIGTWEEELGSVVLEDARVLAYHVPGLRRPHVVVTRGCVERTERAELDAVLAHERAHARGHHQAMLQPFVAWQRTFPFLPAAAAGTRAVALLTEFLADDVAVAEAGRAATIGALGRLGCGAGDAGARPGDAATGDPATLVRLRRLLRDRPPLPRSGVLGCWTAAALVLLAPTLLLART
jgi:Zn-dependent protease with chaperone function